MTNLSVIIPCHNDGATLQRAIDSAMGQCDEVVVCLDACSDESASICHDNWHPGGKFQYCQSHSFVPCGPAVARNIAISHSTGRYILPLDADDELLPGAADKLLEQASFKSFVYGNWREVYADGSSAELTPPPIGMIDRKNIGYATILYPRTAWLDAQGYSPLLSLGGEHWGFMYALLKLGYTPTYTSELIFTYHRQDNRRSDYVNRRFEIVKTLVKDVAYGLAESRQRIPTTSRQDR